MEVKITIDSKNVDTYETDSHKFKIEEITLENLKYKQDFPMRIAVKIQKGMRQKIKLSSGKLWQDSFESIFKEITGYEFKLEEEEE